jgi:hypothetical protein
MNHGDNCIDTSANYAEQMSSYYAELRESETEREHDEYEAKDLLDNN